MRSVILTEEQAKEMTGILFAENSRFNPVQDADDNWTISEIEVTNCVNEDYFWLKKLPLQKHEPKIEKTDLE